MIKEIQIKGLDRSTWDDFNKRVKEVKYYDDNCNCKSVKKPNGYDYCKDYAYCVSTDILMWGKQTIMRGINTEGALCVLVQDCNLNGLLTALTWYCKQNNIEWSFTEVTCVLNYIEYYYEVENYNDWVFLRSEILQRLGFSSKQEDNNFVFMSVNSEMATFGASDLSGEKVYFFRNGDGKCYAFTYSHCKVVNMLLSKFFKRVIIGG